MNWLIRVVTALRSATSPPTVSVPPAAPRRAVALIQPITPASPSTGQTRPPSVPRPGPARPHTADQPGTGTAGETESLDVPPRDTTASTASDSDRSEPEATPEEVAAHGISPSGASTTAGANSGVADAARTDTTCGTADLEPETSDVEASPGDVPDAAGPAGAAARSIADPADVVSRDGPGPAEADPVDHGTTDPDAETARSAGPPDDVSDRIDAAEGATPHTAVADVPPVDTTPGMTAAGAEPSVAEVPDDTGAVEADVAVGAGTGVDEKALAEAATNLWRAERKLRSADQSNAVRQAGRYLARCRTALAEAALEIQDYDGERFHPGRDLDVLDYQEDREVAAETVISTVRPTVYFRDKHIQRGQVIVGYPPGDRADGTDPEGGRHS
ncbi:hypothetical protein [Nocardia sp. alder85J]|uniref:hypothetical protein n=1 Tax=Nocardia sp. alder85J TaxID=2862949 RepID=UPI001CD6C593|nr:hypothetical protein [Nocardia sp. alder85J]MCX4094124.1 hypothetical protein [Nocardia sp. alder85J]